MKRIFLVLLFAMSSRTALGHSIGVFADAQGTHCNLVIPYPGGPVTAYVVATIDGSATFGVESAAFRIAGLPAGWSAVISAPGPDVVVAIGNPFLEGAAVAYPTGVTGTRVLMTLSITPGGSVENQGLNVVPHTDPDLQSCGFEGLACAVPCPHFCASNGFGLDCLCAESLPATINGAPCLVATQKVTWAQVKRTFK